MSEADADFSEFHAGGPTGVLLMHGLGGTPKELRTVTLAVARSGYTVSAPQLAGHCATPEELRRSTWQDWTRSAEEAHAALSARCERVIVGGLSMGAVLALRLAQTKPDDVSGLVLLAPSFRLDGFAMPWYAGLLRLARPGLPMFDIELPERDPHGLKDPRIRALIVRKMKNGSLAEAGVFSTPLASFAQFNSLAAIVRRRLGAVTQPALLVHPRQDDIASIDNALMLQRRLAGAVSTLVLDDSYHLVTVDRQRHVVASAVVAFCNRVLSPSANAARDIAPDTTLPEDGDLDAP